jgi:hypothetical protein
VYNISKAAALSLQVQALARRQGVPQDRINDVWTTESTESCASCGYVVHDAHVP